MGRLKAKLEKEKVKKKNKKKSLTVKSLKLVIGDNISKRSLSNQFEDHFVVKQFDKHPSKQNTDLEAVEQEQTILDVSGTDLENINNLSGHKSQNQSRMLTNLEGIALEINTPHEANLAGEMKAHSSTNVFEEQNCSAIHEQDQDLAVKSTELETVTDTESDELQFDVRMEEFDKKAFAEELISIMLDSVFTSGSDCTDDFDLLLIDEEANAFEERDVTSFKVTLDENVDPNTDLTELNTSTKHKISTDGENSKWFEKTKGKILQSYTTATGTAPIVPFSGDSEFVHFKFRVAENVKKCLRNFYDNPKALLRKYKIKDRQQFMDLCRKFSYQFRDEESFITFNNDSSDGITLTPDNKRIIVDQIDMYFDKLDLARQAKNLQEKERKKIVCVSNGQLLLRTPPQAISMSDC